MVIDHATFAQQSSGAVPAGTPVDLTFDGAKNLTIPVGGEAYSDPLAQPVTAGQPVLVSFHLSGALAFLPEHSWALVAADIPKNRLATDVSGDWAGGHSLMMTRLDQDVLADPNVSTVVIAEGLQDIVAGTDDTTMTSTYQELIDDLQAWGIRAVIMNLTPCDGYGACTAAADLNRQSVNQWVSNESALAWPGIASADANAAVAVDDPNSTATPPEQQLSAQAAPLDLDSGDHVNLSEDGYAAVAATITSALTVLVPTHASS